MTDRELLEFAAKAAGTEFVDGESWDEGAGWDPLNDDGDALRLAVKLEMMVDPVNRVVAGYLSEINVDIDYDEQEQDPYAATRRAITRAAAEIGRNMK